MRMQRMWSKLAGVGLLVMAVATPSWSRGGDAAVKRTALDDYVQKDDPVYAWKIARTLPGPGFTTFVVDMTSQQWRTTADVNRTVWKHWLIIVKPDVVRHETALLLIGGGRNSDKVPDRTSPRAAMMAVNTQSVVAELGMVPNQPLVFGNDGKERFEDDLIAYCYVKFLETGDPTWVPRLPMVKSAVRAMDTMTAVLASEQGGKHKLTNFVVAGGSKRGWTTWLTGVADPRVTAIVPIVIDVLNVKTSMAHHYSAYGFWAPAIGDYVRHRIPERMDQPEYEKLLDLEDPYRYLDRLTLPKYVVNSAGDQFFVPDSSQFYFDELKGPKYLRYVPNSDHSLKDTDALESIQAFYGAILNGKKLPEYQWKVGSDGAIEVRTATKPKEVLLWAATNPEARDFRLMTIGKAYKSTRLEPREGGVYVGAAPKPEKGWTAYFVELTYDVGSKFPLKVTTQVAVTPNELPHSIDEFRRSLKTAAGGK